MTQNGQILSNTSLYTCYLVMVNMFTTAIQERHYWSHPADHALKTISTLLIHLLLLRCMLAVWYLVPWEGGHCHSITDLRPHVRAWDTVFSCRGCFIQCVQSYLKHFLFYWNIVDLQCCKACMYGKVIQLMHYIISILPEIFSDFSNITITKYWEFHGSRSSLLIIYFFI